MKEATGESALTLITIVIVTASIGAVGLNFFTNDSTDSVHIDSVRFAVNSNALTMNYAQKKWLSLNDNSQSSQAFGAASILSAIKIYEIVGINRISGGNA